MTNTVIARVSGMDVALMAVMRPWRRKTRSTMTASVAPISIASPHRLHGFADQLGLVVHGFRCTPGGNEGATVSMIRATLSASASVLPADLSSHVESAPRACRLPR